MDTIKISFDALKRDSWSEQETKNVKLIIEFVQLLMNDHDFDAVLTKFGNPHYVQHNRSIPDGMDALVEYVKSFSKQFPDYTYDVKHIYADGDFVIFHSHITTHRKDRGNDKKGINVHDSWRIKNGQIVAHWDSLQPMNAFLRLYFWLTGGKIANTNGVY
ncbi:nuclear transport factor 2 family protein [Allomuricauda sp. SCSIO 65647]|uniref:nuclear transport factor 2 family protein n=1 Tax=Allomuricauda sp. SCSIO 65647 TaxID=2908843 RepID=UPI001F30D9CF|nr:nuclear transport factor 2 family protein [Muricauda sp. SCSIO 65647]UJH69109.1 nuclear transport factor 2 family protein [Muricauda sp. SCSIO 65647]